MKPINELVRHWNEENSSSSNESGNEENLNQAVTHDNAGQEIKNGVNIQFSKADLARLQRRAVS